MAQKELGGERQTWQLKKVQFQNASNNGYLKFGQDFAIIHFAVVQSVTQLVRNGKRRIVKPNGTSSLVTLEFGVAWCMSDPSPSGIIQGILTVIQVGQKSCH